MERARIAELKDVRDRVARMSGAARPLVFGDFPVGRRFETGDVLVSADEIKSFAGRYDPQPFHLDEAEAAGTVFLGLAASGWLTAALTMRLMVATVKVAGGMIGLGAEVSWPQATRPGDRLRVVSEVTEAVPSRSRAAGGVVTLRSETLNDSGEVVQVMVSRVLVGG